jgi:protein-disulfide isomerase
MPPTKSPKGRPAKGRPGAARPSKPTRSNRRLMVIGLPIAAIAVFAGAIIAIHLATSGGPGTPDVSNLSYVSNAKSEFAGIPSKGNVVGYANAPVTVTEFGDLRCPVCREFDSTVIPDVLQKLVRTHKAKLLYRHWPILGANSVYASRAAYAAEQQNKLWEYALVVYYNQGDENDSWFTKSYARGVAFSIGLNLKKFDKDFDNTSATNAQVAAVNAAANQHNFTGTPSVFVTGPKKTDDLSNITPAYTDIAKAVAKVAPAASGS